MLDDPRRFPPRLTCVRESLHVREIAGNKFEPCFDLCAPSELGISMTGASSVVDAIDCG